MDPERAHRAALTGLAWSGRLGLLGHHRHDPRLARTVMGLRFPSPVGLAAGFDKDATAPTAYGPLGFGFVEIGTVTPLPQSGNERPRLFRLPEDRAVINRMGFNNHGVGPCLERLRSVRSRIGIPLGINVGINKVGADPLRDYPALVARVADVADYIVINVSSPNTKGLRDLQTVANLDAILTAVAPTLPAGAKLLVKLAPDLPDAAVGDLVRAVVASCATGVIVTNTTIARPESLRGADRHETGGLSGAPLAARALEVLELVVAARGADPLVVIACGGIETGQDVARRLDAGADLVQLYTAFAYGGPALIPRIERQLLEGSSPR
jgi:dihydroorotate dehydrogenase